MKISYFLVFFLSICLLSEKGLAGQRPMGPYGARQESYAPLSDDDFAEEGDDYGDENFEDDLAGDYLPPRQNIPMPQRPLPPKTNLMLPPRGGASFARGELAPLKPLFRPGFQQKSGMRAPERMIPAPGEMEPMEGGREDFSLEDPRRAPDMPAELPPRNYPPKMTHLQYGQTEWNQMDLHSLVDGRRS